MLQVGAVLLLDPLVRHSSVQELLRDGNHPGKVHVLRHLPRVWRTELAGLANRHSLKGGRYIVELETADTTVVVWSTN